MLDAELLKFVTFVTFSSKSKQYLIDETVIFKNEIQELCELYQTKTVSDNLMPSVFSNDHLQLEKANCKKFIFYSFPEFPSQNNCYTCVSMWIMEFQNKLNSMTRHLYAEVTAKLSTLFVFLDICINKQVPVKIDVDRLKTYFENYISMNTEYITLEERERLLTAYMLVNIPQKKYQEVQVDKISELMDQYQSKSDIISEYAPYTEFDDAFAEFVLSHNMHHVIDRVVNKTFNKDGLKIHGNFQGILHIINSFFKVFQPDNVEKQILLRTAVIRVIFERIHMQFHYLDKVDQELNNKIMNLAQETPIQFDVPSHFFPQEIMDKPIIEGVRNFEPLKELIDLIEGMQFYINPFDLLYQLVMFSTKVDEYIKKHNMCHEEKITLAFDDFFSILIVFISVSGIENIAGIRFFTEMISDIGLAPIFSYVTTSISAALEYIENK